MSSDITIVIQGRIHKNSIQNINNYKKYGKVIFSLWKDDELWKPFQSLIPNDVIVLFLEPIEETVLNKIYNIQNQYFQFYTTLHALKLVDTEYVIKFRSDELYVNLNPLLEKIKQNPDKLITSNLFVRYFDFLPFHISDHIIAGKTKSLLKTFECCKHICENKEYRNNLSLSVEQFICLVYLKEVLKIPNPNKQSMLDNWDLIDIRTLKPYVYTTFPISWSNDSDNPNGAMDILNKYNI